MHPSRFFTAKQKGLIKDSIREAELNTSGEIRIHIDKRCKGDALDRAAYVFEMLGMHKTKLRNGVLFYLAIEDHKFAILGDAGINSLVPDHFWDEIRDNMSKSFQEGNFTEGIIEGIIAAGNQLKNHFPYQKDDVNELPDEISFGDK